MTPKLLRKLLRRSDAGPGKPPPFVRALADALPASGLTVSLMPPDAPEHALGRLPNARARGLLQIGDGPPDLINCTSVGVGQGHLSQGESTGFHWLMRTSRLSPTWSSARVDARREFSASDIGSARHFRWISLDSAATSRAAAALLQERGNARAPNAESLNDRILRLLQQPELLSLQLEPETDAWYRCSLYLGYERALGGDEIATLRDLCRLLSTRDPASATTDP